MGGMPYIVEKGAVFTVYEDYLTSLDRRLAMLANLSDPHVPTWKAMPLRSPALDDIRQQQQQALAAKGNVVPQGEDPLEYHARLHWRGDPTFDEPTCTWKQPPGQTGWWRRWQGPADAILRETMKRAIEVSIGRAHVNQGPCQPGPLKAPIDHVDPPSVAQRCWPIEILWVCGSNSLQGWITWRRHGAGWSDGQVTVLLTTPSNGYNMYANPTPPVVPDPPPPDYKEAPGTWDDIGVERGMWVVGAAETNPVTVVTTTSVPLAEGVLDLDADGDPDLVAIFVNAELVEPLSYYESRGAIVTVRPSEIDGGVLGSGRTYTSAPS